MSKCSQPGRPAHTGIWFVVNSQNAPDSVFVQVKTERQIDLLSNAGTAVSRIALFHFDDGVDDFL